MGRKGWAGNPPADDDEARKRIIEATMRVIDRRGPAATTLADVADSLRITRRTIYRYFAGTEELFTAVAVQALDGFVSHVDDLVAGLDVGEQLIEIVAYIIERLPHEPQLALLLAHDRANSLARNMVDRDAIVRCREILQHSRIDWAAVGCDEDSIDELVEFLLRIIQSMVVAPSSASRSPQELRDFLRRWIAPSLQPQR